MRLFAPTVFNSDLKSTPRVDTSRAWETLLLDAPTLAELRVHLVEDSANMSLYMHSSKFLDEFLPISSRVSRNSKPKTPDFTKIIGMTSEKSISKEWVSDTILRLRASFNVL